MRKKYIIRLSAMERQTLDALAHTGKATAYRRTHAQIRAANRLVDLGVVKSISHADPSGRITRPCA